eukprot:Em0001g180a
MCTQSNRQYLCKSSDLEDKEYGAVAVSDLLVEQVYVWKTSKGKPYDVKLLRIHDKTPTGSGDFKEARLRQEDSPSSSDDGSTARKKSQSCNSEKDVKPVDCFVTHSDGEGQTPCAPSLSTTVVAAVESVSCPPGAAATPVLAQVTTPAQTPVLPGKNSALVSVHINAVGFMQQHFKDLLDNKKYVDVTFVVEGQPMPAHRLILASQSDYFDRLFYGKMRETNSSEEISLPNAPLEAFRLLLEFMYSGCLDYDNQPLQVVLDLLSLADSYMVGMLKEALSHQLCEHIDLDSVLPILLHASVHSVSLLNEKCLQFVDHHTKEVLTGPSFLPLPKECVLAILSRDSLYVPEEEIFHAVTRWMDHNHHNKDIKDIIACVRLSEISPSVLFALVEPLGFFDGQCILDALRIQMKPELLEMRSRGRLEVDRNLLRETILCPTNTGLYSDREPPEHEARGIPHPRRPGHLPGLRPTQVRRPREGQPHPPPTLLLHTGPWRPLPGELHRAPGLPHGLPPGQVQAVLPVHTQGVS